MNFEMQSALVAGIISLALTLSILAKGFKKPIPKAFAQLSLTIFIWNLGFFLYKVTGQTIWKHLLFIGVLFIPASALQFVFSYLPHRSVRQKRTLKIAYLGGLFFLATVPTPLFDSPWWNISVIAFLLPLFLIALWDLYRYASQIESIVIRRRLQFLSLGGFFAVILAMTDFLPALGAPVPQLGSIAVLFYLYMAAMGIVRYHLFDLPDMIGKGIFLLLQVFILSVLLAFLDRLFGDQAGASIMSALAVTLLILLIEPFRQRFQQEANIWFTQDYKVLQKRLRDYSNRIARATDLKHLEKEVIEALESFPGVKKVKLTTSLTASLRNLLADRDGPLFLKEGWDPNVENLVESYPDGLLFPLRLNTELIGAVELQEKEGQYPYSNRELRTLSVLANQLAAAIVNLRAQEEIRKKEKLAAIGELAAGLAHEIRNPLATIKGAARYLEKNQSGTVSNEFLGIILEEVNRLNAVVSEFLDYARPFKKELAWVNMADLVQQVIHSAKSNGLIGTAMISYECQEELPRVEIDPGQIKQVLHNLIINAIEAMPHGGTLDLSVNTVPDREMIEVKVEDTGVGISSEDLSKLFQPFFTTKERGTGLGLAICYRIVEGHGGSISVESEAKKGSRFGVRLPLRQTLQEI